MKYYTDDQIKAMFHIDDEEKDWLEWGSTIETRLGEYKRIKENKWKFYIKNAHT